MANGKPLSDNEFLKQVCTETIMAGIVHHVTSWELAVITTTS
jgi:hypothetical protein